MKPFSEMRLVSTVFVPTLFIFVTLFFQGCASAPKVSSKDRAKSYLKIATASLVEGDARTALEYVQKSAELDPDAAELYHIRGLAYFQQKSFSEAIEQLKKAIAIKPKYSEAQNTLGKILIDMGRLDEAVAPLQEAAKDELFNERFKAYSNLGIIRYRQSRNTEAAEMFSRAVAIDSDQACIAQYYLGHVALRENRIQDAIKNYDLATRRFCAGFQDAHLALGVAYEQAREYQNARKKYLDIKTRFPNSKVAEQALEHLRYLP